MTAPTPPTALRHRPVRGAMAATLVLLGLLGCAGEISWPGTSSNGGALPFGGSPSKPGQTPGVPGSPEESGEPNAFGRGASGVSRLSRAEYIKTVQALLNVDVSADVETTLPVDNRTPFDNDYRSQAASKPLIEGYQAIAERAAALVLADAAKKAAVIGCTPANSADATCFRSFIERVGRRALRRPLQTAEVDRYAQLLGSPGAQTFDGAVGMALRAFLQTPEFLYRVELGSGEPQSSGTITLTAYELASRLSYSLTGLPPSDAMLDAAGQGALDDAAQLRATVEKLIDSPAGQAQVQRFFAQLWEYESMHIAGAITQDLRRETDALVSRVVFERRTSWLDLFRSTETYANERLRDVYGLPPKPGAGFEWVPYARADQAGILSHGALLSNGASGTDTSPTFRGKFVRERLLCHEMPAPPPDADANLPPADPTQCKPERYVAHQNNPSCASCHVLMDPIGHGLENYDPTGRYRQTEPNKPQCAITGKGEVKNLGSFEGAAGLSRLLTEQSAALERCMLEGLYGYTVGRSALRPDDEPHLKALEQRLRSGNHDLRALMVSWAASDSARTRTIDEVTP